MCKLVFLALLCLTACGCGSGREEKTAIKLEEVPSAAMKTAKEKAPEVATFHEAYLKKDGTYEVRGKTKNGKVIEVEVKEDGTFVDIER
ncbi:MAG TPA: hypothetical protein VG097_13045 [Gemmata sp.]|jgi:hypothetical protein|nr:hypothetical protein [Gemmata sp.]